MLKYFRWLEICPGRDEDHAEYDSDGERQIPTFYVADDINNNHDNNDNKTIIRQAPEVKVHIQFHDEIIYASNLFTVTIDVNEYRPGSPQAQLNFFKNHIININEFSITASSKASKSAIFKQSYVYNYQETHIRRGIKVKMMHLDVKSRLEFKFVGKFAQNFHGAIAGLRSLTSKSLGNLLKDELFSDLTIISVGKMFKVHKCVLANASKVFSSMLSDGLNETKIKPTMINCSADVVENFLKFIYEGHIPFRQMKNTLLCCDLFELAHRYKVQILEEICKRYVTQMKNCKQIDSKNALKVFEFAEMYQFKHLLVLAWPIIKTYVFLIELCYFLRIMKILIYT